jgi:hypothetical protein
MFIEALCWLNEHFSIDAVAVVLSVADYFKVKDDERI